MSSPAEVKSEIRQLMIETPSWAYGNSGTRFKVFPQKGVARTPQEKLEDAAQVNKFTGVAPSVAIHIPWDRVDDYAGLQSYAQSLGVSIGAINPNVFQEEDYKLGSVCNSDPAIRRKATDHLLECVEIGVQTGSTILSLWFSDGTNYPGQDDIQARQERLAEALAETYQAMPLEHAHVARVQVLRARVLHHGRSRLGHVAAALSRLGRPRPSPRRHRPPRAWHQHRVHRRESSCA